MAGGQVLGGKIITWVADAHLHFSLSISQDLDDILAIEQAIVSAN